jgi:PAS domain-containing protein
MDPLSQPQIGAAVMAGLVLGALVLVGMLFKDSPDGSALKQPSPDASGMDEPDKVVFLFAGSRLVQSTETAEVLLDDARESEPPETQGALTDEWSLVRRALGRRFAGLPQFPDLMTGTGQMVLDPARDREKGQLVMDWWDGHIRLSLTDGLQEADSAAAQNEAGWLRQAVTGAPYPIWQSDKAGQVIWANTAYLELVTRFTAALAQDDGCPALFDIPFHQDNDSASFRMSVVPSGSVQPYWFDVRSLRMDAGWMNYATDVNAVVNAEIAQRNFVQTLTKTFAQLSIGLAIFDRKRQLALFNPALIDLTSLPAEFLSARPNLLSFFDRLRDRQMMPEPKNYRSWRDQIADLVAAADSGQYRETWSLPSGMTYRISGRPHPDGAVAFLFEDISAEISLTRRFRSQLELGQSVLNTLDQPIAVFSPTGVLAFSNTAYRKLWGIELEGGFSDISVTEASRHWQAGSLPTPVWGDLRDFVVQFGERAEWQAHVTLRDGRCVLCQVVPMSGGATMVLFRPQETVVTRALSDLLQSPA